MRIKEKVRAERSALIAAYRHGLGLTAIAVASGPQGMRISALPADAESVTAAMEGASALWWCRNPADAARVAAAATRRLRRESNSLTCQADDPAALSRATAAVLAVADKIGAVLQADKEIVAQAMGVAARIETELQKQQQSGGLKAVNQAYRAYRLDSRASGERPLRYDEWLSKYQKNLVRQAALMLRQI